jgi:hypothetical protein
MKSNLKVLIAVAALVLIAVAWWLFNRGGGAANLVDLVEQFPQAEHRSNSQPLEAAFEVGRTTIDGQEKRTILARPSARLIYKAVIPPDAWLEVSFGLRPDSWDQPGDGAQFRVGISEGKTYEELLKQYVNPKRGDRRWFSARMDLSAYEGRQVNLIFNTDPGADAGPHDRTNDLAVWGEPRVYSKR